MKLDDILSRANALTRADAHRLASMIRVYPSAPLLDLDTMPPFEEGSEAWGVMAVEAIKSSAHMKYCEALAWFYAQHRPTNAASNLILTKIETIKRGKDTDTFLKHVETFLDAL